MNLCPVCQGAATVTRSRLNKRGDRIRRFTCSACEHRWTITNGPAPSCKPIANRPPLTEEAIQDILTSDESAIRLSVRHNCSPSAISLIRTGKLHADVLPDLPRYSRKGAAGVSCRNCLHWSPGCDLGHKDPDEEGPGFAALCNNYNPTSAAEKPAGVTPGRTEPSPPHQRSCSGPHASGSFSRAASGCAP